MIYGTAREGGSSGQLAGGRALGSGGRADVWLRLILSLRLSSEPALTVIPPVSPTHSQRTVASIKTLVCAASVLCAVTPAGAVSDTAVYRSEPEAFGESVHEANSDVFTQGSSRLMGDLLELTALVEKDEAASEAVDAGAEEASSYLRGGATVEATDSLASSGALAGVGGEVRTEVAGSSSSVPEKIEYVNTGHTTVFGVLIFVGGVVFVAAGVGILVRWRRTREYASIPNALPVPNSKAAYRLDNRDDAMFMGGASDSYGTGDQEGGEVLFL